METKEIPVNIWDDYYDDCTGKTQKTFIYIEQYSNISIEYKLQCLTYLLKYIQSNIELENVIMKISDRKYEPGTPEIFVKNMTHVQREYLLKKLIESKLKYNNIAFDFYSES